MPYHLSLLLLHIGEPDVRKVNEPKILDTQKHELIYMRVQPNIFGGVLQWAPNQHNPFVSNRRRSEQNGIFVLKLWQFESADFVCMVLR